MLGLSTTECHKRGICEHRHISENPFSQGISATGSQQAELSIAKPYCAPPCLIGSRRRPYSRERFANPTTAAARSCAALVPTPPSRALAPRRKTVPHQPLYQPLESLSKASDKSFSGNTPATHTTTTTLFPMSPRSTSSDSPERSLTELPTSLTSTKMLKCPKCLFTGNSPLPGNSWELPVITRASLNYRVIQQP